MKNSQRRILDLSELFENIVKNGQVMACNELNRSVNDCDETNETVPGSKVWLAF